MQEERGETVVPKETARAALSLSDVRFDFDRYDLRPDMLPVLAEHVRQLQENPRVRCGSRAIAMKWAPPNTTWPWVNAGPMRCGSTAEIRHCRIPYFDG